MSGEEQPLAGPLEECLSGLSVTQELIDALDRLPFFSGDRLALLGKAMSNTAARRAEVDQELHDAVIAARQRFNRRVNALLEDQEDDANGPSLR